jgi:hypothetical protein
VVFEDSYIYIFGGYESSGRIDTIEQYDVANDVRSVLPIKFLPVRGEIIRQIGDAQNVRV